MDGGSSSLSGWLLRLDLASTPIETLDLTHLRAASITEEDVRKAYRTLALSIHPDKCPNPILITTYQRLFVKVQNAHNELLRKIQDDDSEEEADDSVSTPAALPETWESLHARNIDNRERLKAQRQEALDMMHEGEWKQPSLQGTRESQWQTECEEARKRTQQAKANPQSVDDSVKRAKAAKTLAKKLQKEERAARKVRIEAVRDEKELRPKTKLQEARKFMKSGDAAVTSKEMAYRDTQALLSGRTSTVSSSQRTERENTGAAKQLRDDMLVDHEREKRTKIAIKAAERGQGMVGFSMSMYEQVEQEVEASLEKDMESLLGGKCEPHGVEEKKKGERASTLLAIDEVPESWEDFEE